MKESTAKMVKDMKDKIETEKKQKLEEKRTTEIIVANSLEELRKNETLSKMYNDSKEVGASNLSGELPLLKVHQTGKSTQNELSSGEEPQDGHFFYKPTLSEYETIKCHILTISRGFRAEGLEDGKTIFNQIMGGVIINDGAMLPFIMYFTGLKLQNLWGFGKDASKYTHMKPVAIPMFALTVNLTTEKKSNSFGKSWIINFEIEKNKDGTPVLVYDEGEFQYLKDHVSTLEETIESIISAKSETPQAINATTSEDAPNVGPADIPF